MEELKDNKGSKPIGPLGDVFDDKMINDLKLFKHQTELKDMEKLSKAINNKVNEPLLKNNSENYEQVVEYLDVLLEDYTVDQLKELTPEEVEKIYTMDAKSEDEDAESVIIEVDTKEGQNDFEMKRDYLVFRKESNDANKEIAESMKELQTFMDEYKEEMKTLEEEFGSIETYIIDTLNKKIEENTESPERIELYTKIRDAYEEGFTLKRLTEYVESYRGKNILADFLQHERTMKVYNRYLKMSKNIGLNQDITKFAGLESYIYDNNEIKNVRMNIFVFTVIHFIANQKYDDVDKIFGVFISQVIVNIKNVIYNNFPEGDSKFKFIEAVKHIVEIIG